MVDVNKTLQERGTRYGKYEGAAAASQGLKAVMRGTANWAHLSSDKKEALEMITHKIARILNGDPDYRDSWLDIIGYATLVEQSLKSEKFNPPVQLTIDLDDPNVSVIPSAA
jgi:hypothetical protein